MGRIHNDQFVQQPLSVLTGPQLSRVNIRVSGQLRAIRVDFLPGGLFRLLGIPMNELLDDGFDASHFLGAALGDLNRQLQELPHLHAGKERVEGFLLDRAEGLKELLPFDSAIKMLFVANGNLSIEKTASLSCLSLKQFERKCRERLGMNPKLYARILRFSRAYRLHEAFPALSWTKIGYEAGYFDQMHMIRDFKTFAGVNPSVIKKELVSTPIRMQKDLRY